MMKLWGLKWNEKWYIEGLNIGETGDKRTIKQIKKAMNNISPDVVFNTESYEDFLYKRLPTMRSQVLNQKRSSQYSILQNELTRRFEVLDGEFWTKSRL